MSEPSAEPLAEAQVDSLEELFSRDPLHLTDNDVDKITASLRAQRRNWEVKENAPKAPKAPKQTAAQKKVKALDLDKKLDISFDDLGI
jgi:hypothetical protein